jgi:hypothetical protein
MLTSSKCNAKTQTNPEQRSTVWTSNARIHCSSPRTCMYIPFIGGNNVRTKVWIPATTIRMRTFQKWISIYIYNYTLHKGRLKQRASSVTAPTRTSFRYSISIISQSVVSVSLASKERQWLSHYQTRIPCSPVGDLQIAIHYLDTTRMGMCAVNTIVPITGTDVHLPIIQPHYRRQKVNFPSKKQKPMKLPREQCAWNMEIIRTKLIYCISVSVRLYYITYSINSIQ